MGRLEPLVKKSDLSTTKIEPTDNPICVHARPNSSVVGFICFLVFRVVFLMYFSFRFLVLEFVFFFIFRFYVFPFKKVTTVLIWWTFCKSMNIFQIPEQIHEKISNFVQILRKSLTFQKKWTFLNTRNISQTWTFSKFVNIVTNS